MSTMAEYRKISRADLRAFDSNGTNLVLEMGRFGWKGRWTSANKLRMVSPDGETSVSLPTGLNGRRLENYARPYRRWREEQAKSSSELLDAIDPMFHGFDPASAMLAQFAAKVGWNVRLLVNGKLEATRGKRRFLLARKGPDRAEQKRIVEILARHSEPHMYSKALEQMGEPEGAAGLVEAFDLHTPRVERAEVIVTEAPNTTEKPKPEPEPEPERPYRRVEPIQSPDGMIRALRVLEDGKTVEYRCAHEGCDYSNPVLSPVAVHFARSKGHPKPPKRQPETKPEFVPEKVTVTEWDGPVSPEAPGVILDQVRALVAPQMQEQIDTLTRERDEARAALARVREDLAGVRELMGSIGKEENK